MQEINHIEDLKVTKPKVLNITVVGKPNSGKSTLINYIMNDKICIVSEKPHSTRDNVLAIYNDEQYQLIFTDTPGVNDSKQKVFQTLTSKALNSLKNCDCALFLIDATKPLPSYILQLVNPDLINLAVITKIDLVNHNKLLPLTEKLSGKFQNIFSISHNPKDLNRINYVLDFLKSQAKEEDLMFPVKFVTNKSPISRMVDRVQEVLFSVYDKEIPYHVHIDLDYEIKKDQYYVYITLRVNRSYQPIILGKIHALGPKIRKNLQNYLKKQVHSFIDVKLIKKPREKK